MAHYGRRKDTAHGPIVQGLEAHGVIVFDVSQLGGLGFDILCYHPSFALWMPMEIKSSKHVHHKSAATTLKPSQVKARSRAPIPVVETLDEALRCFQ